MQSSKHFWDAVAQPLAPGSQRNTALAAQAPGFPFPPLAPVRPLEAWWLRRPRQRQQARKTTALCAGSVPPSDSRPEMAAAAAVGRRSVAATPKRADMSDPQATTWLHVASDIELKATDAPPEIRHVAFVAARLALRKRTTGALSHDHEAAKEIAQALAVEHKGSWHVMVGPAFAAVVTHEVGTKVLFTLGGTGVLVFRHG